MRVEWDTCLLLLAMSPFILTHIFHIKYSFHTSHTYFPITVLVRLCFLFFSFCPETLYNARINFFLVYPCSGGPSSSLLARSSASNRYSTIPYPYHSISNSILSFRCLCPCLRKRLLKHTWLGKNLGDSVLVLKRCSHQVVNHRDLKLTWSRETVDCLVTAFYHHIQTVISP